MSLTESCIAAVVVDSHGNHTAFHKPLEDDLYAAPRGA
jgi:hypothetical protein